jgi:hypothetical protein
MLSTWFEVDVTTKEFRHLIEQKDIFDHRETPRKVWVLVESDVTGVAIHIFPDNPIAELAVRPEREAGMLTRMVIAVASRIGKWRILRSAFTQVKIVFKNLLPCCARKPSPVYVPFIPYEMAMVGIQIEIHENKVESVVWNPVPGEDDFREDPDAPPNPTVEVLIDDIDSYLPIKIQDSNPLDAGLKSDDGDDELDSHPF